MADDPFQLRITVNEPWKLHIEVDDQGTTYSGDTTLTADENSGEWDDWGTTFPDASTTGLRTEDGTKNLQDYNDPDTTGDVTIADDQEITDKVIWGRVRFAGEGRIARCILKGPKNIPSGQTGVIDVTGKRGGLAWIEDSLCDPQTPNVRMDFIVGHQYRAFRNRVRGVVDFFGQTMRPEWAWDSQRTDTGIQADVQVRGNWGEYHVYGYPDDNHSDGPHTDGKQGQGGTLSDAIGNRFSGYAVMIDGMDNNPDKPWLLTPPNRWANGAGILWQDNTDCGLDETNIATLNWIEGYVAHANLKNVPDRNHPYEFSHNRHSTDVAIGPSAGMSGSKLSGYWIRLQSHFPVTGLDTNVWWNGPQAGQKLTEPRPEGIHYDS